MSALWTAAEAAAATSGSARGRWTAHGVSIDTRTLAPADLFVALTGEARDGHHFVGDALAKGAAAALVSRVPDGVSAGAPLLVVKDTQIGLESLARAARARTHARIVAVTGSAGKTTTKEMLRLMCASAGSVAASAASYNNHWGVPLSLARMDRETQFGVFEIGMNHHGEIRALVAQVRPHVAIITTVAAAHLEYFGTVEEIAKAKAEIFEGLVPGGVAVLPVDHALFPQLKARAEAAGVKTIRTFGMGPAADARLLSARAEGASQKLVVRLGSAQLEFVVGAAGAHIASNALAALLAAQALGIEPERASAALAPFAPLKGRGAQIVARGLTIIDESYNANPASMSAALALLAAAQPSAGGRRIAILGDMLELGAESLALHRAIGADIDAARADLVFLCGQDMRALWEALPDARRGAYAATSATLAPDIRKEVRPGDVVLVKGSFGSRMATIIEALTAPTNAETA